MSKKSQSTKKKEREAKHNAARRHPKNDNTPEVIPLSDQAADDPTINTASADDGLVIDDTPAEAPEKSYDLSGKGDDLVDDTQDTDQPDTETKTPTNEEMALESARAAAALEDDKEPFWVGLANIDFKTPLKTAWTKFGNFVKPANDAVVNGWIYLTDKVIEPAVDKFYIWCDKHLPKVPNLVTVSQLKTLTATLADVFAEVANENRISNAQVLSEVAELKQQIALLTKAVNGKHPMTIPANLLNEVFELIRDRKLNAAANKYMQATGSTLAVAKMFVGSVSVSAA